MANASLPHLVVRARWTAIAALTLACSAPVEPNEPIDGAVGDTDTARDARADAPSADGGRCAGTCDDGLFCNGTETCAPSSPMAGPDGCVHSGDPCTAAGSTCDEAIDECVGCTATGGDMDHDGARSASCGGGDCDDNDASRHPGATEVCDVRAVDEDCDPATYGYRDADADDAPDARCCNSQPSGPPICGNDCDDMRTGTHPGATETCNGSDDDCDAATDEGVLTTYYVDADGDMFGVDDASTNLQRCTPLMGYAIQTGDCDDTRGFVNPGAFDRCDMDGSGGAGLDDDCNGTPNDPPGGCTCSDGTPARSCMGALGACASGTESCVAGHWGTCSIAPATEVCDGVVDEDCDGVVDDGVTVTCWSDGDGDGYAGLGAPMVTRCPDAARPMVGGCPVGFTNREPLGVSVDCDDARRDSNPAAPELCNGLNDDCDTAVDEGLIVTCFADSDNDTYPASGATSVGLCPVTGRPTVGNCPVGFTNRATSSDCDDLDGTRSPGTLETCNGIDDDCDGTPDDGVGVLCYVDADGDTYALGGTPAVPVCPDPSRMAVGGCPVGRTNRAPMGLGTEDCNDVSAAVSPAAVEVCEVPGVDNDCDATINEGVGVTCYADPDNDTYAAAGVLSSSVCPDPMRPAAGNCPTNFTDRAPANMAIDCAEGNPSVHPGVAEACDGVDNNCVGGIDEGVGMTYYRDGDDDGYGTPSLSMFLCNPPPGYVTNSTDCNDAVAAVHPTAAEVCNDFDDDCDGMTNEGFSTSTFYRDADGDMHGTPLTTRAQCGPYGGYVATSNDCDDANPSRYGGASEVCGNGIDEDCTGVPDDNTPTWYRDFDGDTYGRDAGAVVQCTAPTTGAWVLRGGDCRDDVGFASVNPGAMELCDGYDTDCTTTANASEGEVPNSFGLNHPLEDNDGDGHGDDGCMLGSGAADGRSDCDDGANDVYAGAIEIVGNGVDNDCGAGEICFVDADSDGFRTTNTTLTVISPNASCGESGEGALAEPPTDCLDSNPSVNPSRPDLPDNGLDDNCSGRWGCYYDADDDGYSRSDAAVRDDSADNACTGTGEGTAAEPRTDCNDTDPSTSPGDAELADNGVDDNCNGFHGCYFDADDDGYSRSDAAVRDDSTDSACTGTGEGSAGEPRTDCNDTAASAYPGGTLVADDHLDNNCNGFYECWYDADNDGYSRSDSAIRDDSTDNACTGAGEGMISEPRTDCNDASSSINPSRTEIPDNAVDENCSGTWGCYFDADNDGYRLATVRDDSNNASCLDSGEGTTSDPTGDCCDTSATFHPGATSWGLSPQCGTLDINCDGTIETRYPAGVHCSGRPMATCNYPNDLDWTTATSTPACGTGADSRLCQWTSSCAGVLPTTRYQTCR